MKIQYPTWNIQPNKRKDSEHSKDRPTISQIYDPVSDLYLYEVSADFNRVELLGMLMDHLFSSGRQLPKTLKASPSMSSWRTGVSTALPGNGKAASVTAILGRGASEPLTASTSTSRSGEGTP